MHAFCLDLSYMSYFVLVYIIICVRVFNQQLFISINLN